MAWHGDTAGNFWEDGNVPSPFEPSLLEHPRWTSSFEQRKTVRKPVEEEGVTESIYTNWIKEELQKEEACLELPFSIVFLFCFATFALTYLSQDLTIIVEDSIETDLAENANFAFSNNFGHKGINDVNSFADFWSWTRLGLIPLVFPTVPYGYSESLSEAVPPGYDVDALPTRRPYAEYQKPAPIQNDYLRYNRIIGGLRFRQEVSMDDSAQCTYPGPKETFKDWLKKPCTHFSQYELPPDLVATESFSLEPQRIEWFLPEVQSNEALVQHAIDMEDGCVSANAQNRSCLCEWCKMQGSPHPWLDGQTQRVEISFITYNAHYGMYNLASVNFWFNRGGHIFKAIFVRSSWAGLGIRDPVALIIIAISGLGWISACLYVAKTELIEIMSLIRSTNKLWYYTVAEDYLGFWNCVDWCSVIMTTVICTLFGMLHLQIGQCNEMLGNMILEVDTNGYPPLATHREDVRAFNDAVEAMLDTERSFRVWMQIYPMVLLSRLFKSFSAQKRLAIVSDTFIVARNDLMHFCIVFLSVYFCMTVNAVIFFGQDVIHFATLDRALHACFRAMLGDWDWDSMDNIGLWDAFVWFFSFMMVMVMVLLNMLLAILMEAYGIVKEDAQNADSLLMQIRSMVRRAQQNKRKERVKLNDIWDALYRESGGDENLMLSSDRKIFPSYLVEIVEGIPATQAKRTLTNSRSEYDRKMNPPFELTEFKEGLTKMVTRLDYSALCAIYVNEKLRQYQDLAKAEGRDPDTNSLAISNEAFETANTSASPGLMSPSLPASHSMLFQDEHSSADKALEKVRQIAQERATEMADGIASILGEEMQELERRQFEQRKSINTTCEQLQSLREMIHKLNKTCLEVGEVATRLGQAEAQMPQAIPAASSSASPAMTPLPAALTDGTVS